MTTTKEALDLLTAAESAIAQWKTERAALVADESLSFAARSKALVQIGSAPQRAIRALEALVSKAGGEYDGDAAQLAAAEDRFSAVMAWRG